jgi:hypothetical protein
MEEIKVMKKRFVLIAALVAALAMVLFTGCPTSVDAASREGTFPPPAPSIFADAEGLTTGIAVQGDAVFDDDTGTIDCTAATSRLFILTLPAKTTAAGSKKIKISYVCYILEGNGKITMKDGGWGNPATANGTDGCNWYPELANLDDTAVLELNEGWYAAGTEKISFQVNDYSTTETFLLKITKIVME